MATKPIISEAIVLTEKKMEMSLDDIIKMSKKTASKEKKGPMIPNKSRGFRKSGSSQTNFNKVQNFMESRSSIRQGILARRRSNMPGNQFPVTTEVAKRAAVRPVQNRVVNGNRQRFAQVQRKVAEGKAAGKGNSVSSQRQTLDARFASMKEQRTKMTPQQMTRGGWSLNAARRRGMRQLPRGRDGATPGGTDRRNFARY